MRDPTTNVTDTLVRETEARLRQLRSIRPEPEPQQKRRGRPEKGDYHVEIGLAVAALVEFGLTATRSHAKRRSSSPSACSIVKAALARLGEHVPERTVEDIWRYYKGSFDYQIDQIEDLDRP